jgi:zinc protease
MRRKLISFIAAGFLLTFPALAQQPQGADAKPLPGKVTRLNRVPVNNEILKVKLPHPNEFSLANGLTVLVLEEHRLPTVNYSLWIKSGALSDPADMPGLASFTADMLREGTATRTSSQIAAQLDELGATFNGNAAFGSNLTVLQASGLSQSADMLMELLSDLTRNPKFPADELEKFKRQERARLSQARSNPGILARERFYRAVYGDFPASVQLATSESIQKATPEALKGFHDAAYLPNNAILAIAGDITVAQATALVKKHFGTWQSHPIAAPKWGNVPASGPAKIYLVDRPGSVQSNILMGGLSLRRSDPDYIPLVVMNRILGGSASARLFANLREDKGYTYGAYSRVSSDLFPGVFSANTEVRNPVTDGSLHELMYELKRIRDEKVPAAELEDAKRAIVSSFALSLENPQGIMNSWMTVKYYGLPENYWDNYSDQVAKIDAAAVQQMARKYIDLDHLQIVVVGDAKEVREAVNKYGTVSVFDADGKPQEPKPETGTPANTGTK